MSDRVSGRPQAISSILALNVVNAVLGVGYGAIWPDVDERGTVVVVSLLFAITTIATALVLLMGMRWAAIGNALFNALSALLAIPGFMQGNGAVFDVLNAVSVLICAVTIALIFSPAARSFWSQRRAPAAA